ncbi:hypothetical protein DWY25_17335 [Holdemania filiformis]|uniref:Uncharacterized protein n=1 Tax=Holdemania filiformis TaxID=61171 RepID=A0A412FFK1_9FIRM|nr:hypothetical protein [Holdemania filiformis]RGR66878.1 hypothetical protein DWY25_17335 [Holdemania filiformis]
MFTNRIYKDDLKRICQIYQDLDIAAMTAKVVTKRYLIKMGDTMTFAADMRVKHLPSMAAFVEGFDWVDEWDGDTCFTWYIVPILTVSPLVSARAGVDIN